ncbi:MAG: hypothetical protein J5857_04370 [Treponema sp.]|nr:hypothetical protein [Treponema sp.]
MMENEIAVPDDKALSVYKPKKKTWRVLRFLIAFFLFIILLILIWVGICWMQKVPARSVIPSGYSVFMHTDSAYETFDPLLDLKATELFMSAPELRGAGDLLNELKNSGVRNKKSFKKLTSRKTDIAFYSDDEGLFNFLAVIDMGPYACLSRLSPLFLKHIKQGPLKDIEYVKDDSFLPYYKMTNQGSDVYFKPYKNLIIASSSMKLFTRALLDSPFEDSYTQEEELAFSSDKGSLKMIVKPRVLFRALTGSNMVTREIDRILSEKIPASISLDVSESNIKINMSFPIDSSRTESPLGSLLTGKSTVPSFGSNLNGSITNYTLLNIGTLYDIKEDVFPLFPEELKAQEIWSGAQYFGKILFGMKLDDILFSWSGKEMAVLGIKGEDNPVFALEVSDTEKMIQVFKTLSSSPLVKTKFSKGKNGVILQQLKLPSFMEKLLLLFKIKLSSPYFFVQDGYLYLSQSPQALSAVYDSSDSSENSDNYVLKKNVYWDLISGNAELPASISVYYDLKEKTPFFMDGDSAFTRALSYYSSGRCDISFDTDTMNINLCAFSTEGGSSRNAGSFPVKTEGVPTSELMIEKTKKAQRLFWIEDESVLRSLDIKKMEQKTAPVKLEDEEKLYAVVADNSKKKDALLWCVTASGNVYLLNGKFEVQKGFPVSVGSPLTSDIECSGDSVLFSVKDDAFVTVSKDGAIQKIDIPFKGAVQSKPVILDNLIAVCDRTYIGAIYIIQDGKCINTENPIIADGLGYGSPELVKIGGKPAVSFITQDGQIKSWWTDGTPLPASPVLLEGNFYCGVKTDGKNLYAISEDARIFKVSYSGKVEWKMIPGAEAKDAYISSIVDEDGFTLYVTVNGNKIYAFNSELNLEPGYPVSGYGKPVILDIDGDKETECLTADKEKRINAFCLRR